MVVSFAVFWFVPSGSGGPPVALLEAGGPPGASLEADGLPGVSLEADVPPGASMDEPPRWDDMYSKKG